MTNRKAFLRLDHHFLTVYATTLRASQDEASVYANSIAMSLGHGPAASMVARLACVHDHICELLAGLVANKMTISQAQWKARVIDNIVGKTLGPSIRESAGFMTQLGEFPAEVIREAVQDHQLAWRKNKHPESSIHIVQQIAGHSK